MNAQQDAPYRSNKHSLDIGLCRYIVGLLYIFGGGQNKLAILLRPIVTVTMTLNRT